MLFVLAVIMKRMFFLIVLLLLVGCVEQKIPDSKSNVDKLNVVVSFHPLAEFTKAVGGDRVDVQSLVPNGVEPHDWDPSPQDMITLVNADVFIYNGGQFEGWIDKASQSIDPKKTKVLEVSAVIAVVQASEKNGLIDPHFWLDPVLVSEAVDHIKNVLEAADPRSAELYRFNAEKYKAKLSELDAVFKNGLKSCLRREFVTSHDAFGHLARRYALKQIPIAGVSPEAEPTPQETAKIVSLVKAQRVSTFFMETLISPRLVEALARDAGAKVDVLNPFEGLTEEEQASGADYFSVMEQNLNKLKRALNCA